MIMREIMVSPVMAVYESCPLEDAVQFTLDGNIGCLPVVNENCKPIGIVTDSDFAAKEKEIPPARFPRSLGEWLSHAFRSRMRTAARPLQGIAYRNTIYVWLPKPILARFCQQKIQIPYPQRDVHLFANGPFSRVQQVSDESY